MVGDSVNLKISSMKGVMRFGEKKETQSPVYVGSYEVLKCIESIAYELKLPIDWIRCIQCSMYQ